MKMVEKRVHVKEKEVDVFIERLRQEARRNGGYVTFDVDFDEDEETTLGSIRDEWLHPESDFRQPRRRNTGIPEEFGPVAIKPRKA